MGKTKVALPKQLAELFPANTERYGNYVENPKFDIIFCFLNFNESDVNKLMEISLDDTAVIDILTVLHMACFSVKITPLDGGSYTKVSVTGCENSAAPLYCVTSESPDMVDALTAVFYKMRQMGFPDAINVKLKEKRERKRFS